MSTRIKLSCPPINTKPLRKRRSAPSVIQCTTRRTAASFSDYEERIKRLLKSCDPSTSLMSKLRPRSTCIMALPILLALNLSKAVYCVCKATRYPASSMTIVLLLSMTCLTLSPLKTACTTMLIAVVVAYGDRLYLPRLETYLERRLTLVGSLLEERISMAFSSWERRQASAMGNAVSLESVLPLHLPIDGQMSENEVAQIARVWPLDDHDEKVSRAYLKESCDSPPPTKRPPPPLALHSMPRLPSQNQNTDFLMELESNFRRRQALRSEFDQESWLIISKPACSA
ncbi:hypothetical protein D9613_011032 [Agrocybe pediades]|uniref:Uncharacterized protein n=1 Tax=Agrocybe pediades TaxID=84607 RepID=A0A8H4QLX9_9AGAR|nr:hypothetical protein D9613_011032 [Agrocybe pediades]